MVHVYHVVARFKLAYLFQCERHFAAACPVGAQAVLVEAVEDLVVGEDAEAQVVVDEPLVDGLLHWGERHFLPSVIGGEDVFQSLQLFDAVGQHIDAVALRQVVGEALAEQVEILVEQRLLGGLEVQCGLWNTRGVCADFDALQTADCLAELCTGDELRLFP